MFEVRAITPDEVELFRSRVSRGFGNDADDDEAATARFEAIFEMDRTLAVFDDDDIIGTGAGFSLGVTVPGGSEVPMAGTTVITVQPTHRRRGVLRSLMGRHLQDVVSHDEPLAGLWASEGSIYGRFGYGPATFRHIAEMSGKQVELIGAPPKGEVRLVEPEEAEPALRLLYERARPMRAGMLTRSDGWWEHRLMADPQSWRGGKSAKRYLLHEENGNLTGYATYRQKSNWEDFIAAGEVEVDELVAITSAAHTGIWQFLTNIDLYPNVEWWNMPVDDPLPMKVADGRRVRRKVVDALWIRVMDVPAALTARSYDRDGVVTIEVRDQVRPENGGVYRLEVVGGEASCERVSATAELGMDVDVLGHLYLGGGDALALAGAGRIDGGPEAVSTLHRIMRTDRQPWCNEVF